MYAAKNCLETHNDFQKGTCFFLQIIDMKIKIKEALGYFEYIEVHNSAFEPIKTKIQPSNGIFQ